MNEEVIYQIKAIRMHSMDGRPSPHKPILILYAIAAFQRGQTALLFEKVEDELRRLLDTYGTGTKARPEYPFVRMVSDGIWQLDGNIQWQPNKDFTLTDLREGQVKGSFTPEVIEALKHLPTQEHIIRYLLGTYFSKDVRDALIADLRLTLSEA